MKNSLNLAILIFIVIVLGCSCPMSDIQRKDNEISKKLTNPDSLANTEASPANDVDKQKSSSLTLANYNRAKIGMKLSEVADILGGKGSEVSSSKAEKTKIFTYKWEGKDYSYIICKFNNDKLMMKSQSKLK